ncbi:hypothetical protein SERLA73DRAFT_68653 [Serpula lacrymans var. lacrymans S7.3]|uniref:Uncharacterized protein n=1 Tax=Serpula lacrymans var. lacrymans (strain S7.3) TaxID=936435 RepID=F8PHF7_SERL3|nr:hypothetical protein SERLA73DRAFT_68653 [Serpula lacrymans var. lacrymans S7.3]
MPVFKNLQPKIKEIKRKAGGVINIGGERETKVREDVGNKEAANMRACGKGARSGCSGPSSSDCTDIVVCIDTHNEVAMVLRSMQTSLFTPLPPYTPTTVPPEAYMPQFWWPYTPTMNPFLIIIPSSHKNGH